MEPPQSPETPTSDSTSAEFAGRWQRLVSTTNWEKGRIIVEWRGALEEADAEPSECSDEAWSRRVGNVTPQHVGRLRRVYERFGQVAEEYPGLYWSHFQASLDWNDAEMWLQGAVENRWSVSRMRNMRWEAIGAPANLKPREEDIISAELDEDFGPDATDESLLLVGAPEVVLDPAGVTGASEIEPDDRNAAHSADSTAAGAGLDQARERTSERQSTALIDLEGWPDDLADALEQLKLAILRHKTEGWKDVAPQQVLAALAGLEGIVRSGDA